MVWHTNVKPIGIRKHPAKEFLKNFENRLLKTASKFCKLTRSQNTMKYWTYDLNKKILWNKLDLVSTLYSMKKIDSLLKKLSLLSNPWKRLHSSKNLTIFCFLLERSTFEIFQKFFFELSSKAQKHPVCVPQSATLEIEGLSKFWIRAISEP